MELFHGSNVIVQKPKVLTNGHYKDFGYGFYCTNLEKQAIKWALTKRKSHVVNVYEYKKNVDLKICSFPEMTEEGLDFVVNCRKGIEHEYDIVEGPMADDTIWNFVNDYLSGNISKAVFWEYAKFKHPSHQISFHSMRALECLAYERSENVDGGTME